MKKMILQLFVGILLIGLFCGAAAASPVVKFSYNVTSAPLTISFTDLSANETSNSTSSWEFGDGQNSIEHNPTHNYSTAGI